MSEKEKERKIGNFVVHRDRNHEMKERSRKRNGKRNEEKSGRKLYSRSHEGLLI